MRSVHFAVRSSNMHPEWKISAKGYIALAGALLILPMRFLLAAVVAAAIHEGCHCLAIRLCGGQIYGVHLDAWKTMIETEPMEGIKGILCAGAGPVGSLGLLCFAKLFPLLALCAMVQGLYNLLPIYPMDGGRILHCFLELIMPGKGAKIAKAIGWGTSVTVLSLCVYGAIRLKYAGVLLLAAPIAASKALSVKNTLQRAERTGTI